MTDFRVVGFLIVLAVAIASWALTCAAWYYDDVVAGVVPLDPREFEGLTLVTLGTGGAHENPDRRGPAVAVGHSSDVVLVDAGRAVAESLRASEIPVRQPDTVLLTSLMPENTLGLDDLLATAWIGGRRKPLRLLGPAGTAALAASVEAAVSAGIAARARGLGLEGPAPRFAVEEISEGLEMRIGAMAIRAGFQPGGPVEAFAYRFEGRGRSVVVSGAGWAPDALVALAQGADALVHEAVSVPSVELARELGLEAEPESLRREQALYTTIEEVGRLARRARVDALVLVRMRPPPVFDFQVTGLVGESFDGKVIVAEDGDDFPI